MTKIDVDRRKFASLMLLIFGSLSWFFVFTRQMSNIFNIITSTTDWGNYVGNTLFYGSIILSALVISYIGSRIARRKLLFTSIILGIFSTILLGFLEGTFFATILSCLMGISLGLGLPSSMALIADYTSVENRGRVSGILILGTFITASVAMGLDVFLKLDTFGLIMLLAVLRSISIIPLCMEKFERIPAIPKKRRLLSYNYKDFIVYISVFFLFSVASGLAWNLIPAKFQPQVDMGSIIRYALIAVFGIVAGIMADRVGRKQPIIIGLATLGVGFLLIGFNPSGESVLIYSALSGITWGSFFVVFLAIPGDLSFPSSREKFYALGYILPLTGLFIIAAIPTVSLAEIADPATISQFLGFCLFIAIYPLSRAKETLTESKKHEREIKEHLEMVKKMIQEEK